MTEHPLARERYISLATFRRSGEAVWAPVWIAPAGEDLAFVSMADAGKVKRLRRDDRVLMRPCDFRGRVPDSAPTYGGTARFDLSRDGVRAARRATERKYLLARIGGLLDPVLSRLRAGKPRAAIFIRPQTDPQPDEDAPST